MADEQKTVRINLPLLTLDREKIAKRLRVPETSKKREELWAMIDTIESLASPAIYYRRIEPQLHGEEAVTLGEEKFPSKSLNKVIAKHALANEDGKKNVVAFAATWGQEASDWGNAREFGLPIFWAQTILEEGMLLLMAELEKELKQINDSAVSYLEPGIPEDWPLDTQKNIFRILGGESGDFGIMLNDQSLMLPFKYMAGLAYFSKKLLPQCGICHFTDCNKARGGCWRLQALKRRREETGQEVEE